MTHSLTPAHTLCIDQYLSPYRIQDFWHWAFSSITTPVIRGVMIEYIISQYLMDEADTIVLDRVKDLTRSNPAPGQIKQSLMAFYGTQPHGDVFDLQLTWGVTVELKSSSNTDNWRLHKTCRWNQAANKNIREKVFPAQYYILAVMQAPPVIHSTTLDLAGLQFYVCSGRTLDEQVDARAASVGFSKFAKCSVKCDISQLARTLYDVQAKEHRRVRGLLMPGWKIPSAPIAAGTRLPLAIESASGVDCAWYEDDGAGLKWLADIDVAWKPHARPDWRDWESAGFKYEPPV